MTMMMKTDSVLKEMDERNLRPRLCYLTKGERGYGFHLHGERISGAQFIRKIEAGSPAELAGLRSGDRVVEVNGENVEKETHQEVVQKIMDVENRTRLLVVDRETDEFLLLHAMPCTEDLAVEMSCLLSPRTPSSSLASSTLSFSSSVRGSLTPSPPGSIILSPRDITHSVTDSISPSLPPKSITSSPPDTMAPLSSDSIIPSPQNSTPPSPRKSVTLLPVDSITQSPSNSITQSPTNSTTESPTKSIPRSPTNSITQSPTKSIPPSPFDSSTHSPTRSIPRSPNNSITQSPIKSFPPSPFDSITQSPTNSITHSPTKSTPRSPTNSITQSPTKSFPPSPFDSITQTPTKSIPRSPINSITQSPTNSIPQSPTESITTSFCRKKSNETYTKDITTNNNKEISVKEDTVMQDLRPRLCHITKGRHGFGFNLHCDKRHVGHFIRSVDPDSPAQTAGLQPGDRLVQVNGRSVEGLRHTEVVEIIRGGGGQTRLLVVDPETDALFQKLCITPTTVHLNEDCVDGPMTESPSSLIRSPITDLTLTDPPTTNGSVKQESYGSSASSRSITSETSVELRSTDPNNKVLDFEQRTSHSVPDVPEVKDLDPLRDSGLHLSSTAAEARQKARSKRANKRAPPMAWNKKYEIFSNF